MTLIAKRALGGNEGSYSGSIRRTVEEEEDGTAKEFRAIYRLNKTKKSSL